MDCDFCGYGEATMMHARLCAKDRMPHVSQVKRDIVTKMPQMSQGAVTSVVEVSVQHRCSECGEMHKRKLTAKEKKEAAAARKRTQREREEA